MMKRQVHTRNLSLVLLVVFSLLMLFPFYWMLRSSFMTNREIMTLPIQWLPSTYNFDNYVKAFSLAPFGRYFLNSIIIVSLNLVGSILSSSFIAFGGVFHRRQHLVSAIGDICQREAERPRRRLAIQRFMNVNGEPCIRIQIQNAFIKSDINKFFCFTYITFI